MASSDTKNVSSVFPFFDLPPELRCSVYLFSTVDDWKKLRDHTLPGGTTEGSLYGLVSCHVIHHIKPDLLHVSHAFSDEYRDAAYQWMALNITLDRVEPEDEEPPPLSDLVVLPRRVARHIRRVDVQIHPVPHFGEYVNNKARNYANCCEQFLSAAFCH